MNTRRRSKDSNNNCANVDTVIINTTTILDGSIVSLGDFAWLRHNQCLDTPVIIQTIPAGKSIEFTPLDNTEFSKMLFYRCQS